MTPYIKYRFNKPWGGMRQSQLVLQPNIGLLYQTD